MRMPFKLFYGMQEGADLCIFTKLKLGNGPVSAPLSLSLFQGSVDSSSAQGM